MASIALPSSLNQRMCDIGEQLTTLRFSIPFKKPGPHSPDVIKTIAVASSEISRSLQAVSKEVVDPSDLKRCRGLVEDFRCTQVLARLVNKIPMLEGGGHVCLEPFAGFDEALRLGIPVSAIDQLPDEIFGKGGFGQVYRSNSPSGPLVIKIRKPFIRCADDADFYPKRVKKTESKSWEKIAHVGPQDKEKMLGSFVDALGRAKAHSRLPKSPHYTQCLGIVYVRELNVFAVAYNYVHGPLLKEAMPNLQQKALKILYSLSQTLKSLDECGYPYFDFSHHGNVILADGNIPVLFDDLAEGEPSRCVSELSRDNFVQYICDLLAESFKAERHRTMVQRDWDRLGPELNALIDRSVERTWERIIAALQKLVQ